MASARAVGRRFHTGSPRAWAMTLGALAVLSFAAAIPLSLLAHQVGNGVIAAVIGLPCAMVGVVNEFAGRLQDVVDPDAVRADLAGVVHAALEPTHVSIWLSR